MTFIDTSGTATCNASVMTLILSFRVILRILICTRPKRVP